MCIPAGVLPDDERIEFFAKPGEFGKCYFTRYGQTMPFHELPAYIILELHRECFSDKSAFSAMRSMGIEPDHMVEQYNWCNRGRFDGVPDRTEKGKLTKEFFDCGRRGKCPGENLVCSPLVVNGSRITHREHECLRLIAKELSYKEIMREMGFRSITAVNSLMQRLRDKTGCQDRTALALTAKEAGI